MPAELIDSLLDVASRYAPGVLLALIATGVVWVLIEIIGGDGK